MILFKIWNVMKIKVHTSNWTLCRIYAIVKTSNLDSRIFVLNKYQWFVKYEEKRLLEYDLFVVVLIWYYQMILVNIIDDILDNDLLENE